MLTKAKAIHFFAGVACAAMALPFGIIAAALTPVVIGFAKEICLHFTGKKADANNFAWMIVGAATFVLCFSLLVPAKL